jgi:hypothetical protein
MSQSINRKCKKINSINKEFIANKVSSIDSQSIY